MSTFWVKRFENVFRSIAISIGTFYHVRTLAESMVMLMAIGFGFGIKQPPQYVSMEERQKKCCWFGVKHKFKKTKWYFYFLCIVESTLNYLRRIARCEPSSTTCANITHLALVGLLAHQRDSDLWPTFPSLVCLLAVFVCTRDRRPAPSRSFFDECCWIREWMGNCTFLANFTPIRWFKMRQISFTSDDVARSTRPYRLQSNFSSPFPREDIDIG